MSIFDCGLNIGQTVKNQDIVDIYKCANMGGMRRSKATNTLVLVTDYTKGIYHDKWIAGTLHYTGTGKEGDQKLTGNQNITLAESRTNGVDIHLFEVLDEGKYIFCGHVQLMDKPYTDTQPDVNGNMRRVWVFPIRPVPENNVIKMELFTFKDMDDYRRRGKAAEEEFREQLKKLPPTDTPIDPDPPQPEPLDWLIGKSINHKQFGTGYVQAVNNNYGIISVNFDQVGAKDLDYQKCIDSRTLEIIYKNIS